MGAMDLPLSCARLLREFVYMRRGASSRTFSRWRMRCAQPIRLSNHPGLVEGSIFSRPGVREPNPEFLQKSILPYTVSPLDFLDFFTLVYPRDHESRRFRKIQVCEHGVITQIST